MMEYFNLKTIGMIWVMVVLTTTFGSHLLSENGGFSIRYELSNEARLVRDVSTSSFILIPSPWGDLIGKAPSKYDLLKRRVKAGIDVIVGIMSGDREIEYVKVLNITEGLVKIDGEFVERDVIHVCKIKDGEEIQEIWNQKIFEDEWDEYQYWTEDMLKLSGGIVPISIRVSGRGGYAEAIYKEDEYYGVGFSINDYVIVSVVMDEYDSARLMTQDMLYFYLRNGIEGDSLPPQFGFRIHDGERQIQGNLILGIENIWKRFEIPLTGELQRSRSKHLELQFVVRPEVKGQLTKGKLYIKIPIILR